MADYLTGHAEALADKLAVEHRTYKLGSGITSEYGHYVKSLGGARDGTHASFEGTDLRRVYAAPAPANRAARSPIAAGGRTGTGTP